MSHCPRPTRYQLSHCPRPTRYQMSHCPRPTRYQMSHCPRPTRYQLSHCPRPTRYQLSLCPRPTRYQLSHCPGLTRYQLSHCPRPTRYQLSLCPRPTRYQLSHCPGLTTTASLTRSLPPIIQRQCPVSHLPSQAASDSVACAAAVASPHAMGQLVNWRHVHPLGHGSGVSLQGLAHRLANVSLPIKCNLPTVRRLTHTPQLNVQGGNPTRNP